MKQLILLFTLFLCALTGKAQTTGTITGQVTDRAGNPIQGATVHISKTNKKALADSVGKFILSNLIGGDYSLKITSVSFEPVEMKIRIDSSETRELKVSLFPASNSFLNEIVVTSRKKEQLKEDLTSSVTIVNSKAIQDLQTVNNNASDILAIAVPGLALSSGSSSNWGQTLRGRQILVLVDGVPQTTPLRNGSVDMRTIDPYVIERIEVIKGATSIYGNGASGGMINYITKSNQNYSSKISSKTELVSTGSLLNTQGTVGGRIYQSLYGKIKKIDYTASGSYEKTGKVKDADGDVLGPTYGLSNNKVYNGFAKLGYQLADDQRIQLSYNFFKSLEQTNLAEVMGSIKDGRKTLAVDGTTPGTEPGTRWNHNAQLKYSNDDFFAGTGLNVSAYLQDVSTVFFYSPQFEGGGQSTIRSSKKGLRLDFHTPFRLKGAVDADLTYGVDLLNDVTSQPLLDGRTWVPKMNMGNAGPFAQLNATIFGDFAFNGGLRYESIKIGVEDYTTLKPYNASTKTFGTSIDVKGGDLKYGNLVFNSGLRYKKYNFFKPYVNFSQGFSVADVGLVLRAAKVNDISLIQTEAVIVNNYEAGFSTEFDFLRIEGAAYISKSNLGSSFVEQNGFYINVRQPERVYGYELSADVYATKELMVGASYSYVDGKRDGNQNGKYNDAEDTYLGGDRISPSKFTTYVKYSSPSKKLNIRTDLIASGERNRFSPNPTTGVYKTYEGSVKPYQLINLSSSYKVNSMIGVKLGIENLLNKDYFPARSLWPSMDQYYVKGRGTNVTLGLVVDLK
ncbi:TonB-dependent receptor [Pedobacter nyackensis]|uniref:Iron complex outermembrane recepter protein n=1 Tax=Pedobacter nyackensis TaxID=475255 RepID=A0A1W2EGP6_9SPHI|nr:TonB-dependent receptor [Pedobacter nyackensis]SMD08891.1 iron complex outermembrane recepter protein [Pedobacter nyackensis]